MVKCGFVVVGLLALHFVVCQVRTQIIYKSDEMVFPYSSPRSNSSSVIAEVQWNPSSSFVPVYFLLPSSGSFAPTDKLLINSEATAKPDVLSYLKLVGAQNNTKGVAKLRITTNGVPVTTSFQFDFSRKFSDVTGVFYSTTSGGGFGPVCEGARVPYTSNYNYSWSPSDSFFLFQKEENGCDLRTNKPYHRVDSQKIPISLIQPFLPPIPVFLDAAAQLQTFNYSLASYVCDGPTVTRHMILSVRTPTGTELVDLTETRSLGGCGAVVVESSVVPTEPWKLIKDQSQLMFKKFLSGGSSSSGLDSQP